MTGLESLEEDDPKRILFYTPMGCLGQIRSHRRDETWSVSICQTFFGTGMGTQIPVISEKPPTVCDCRKFQIDPLGDHITTCNSDSGAKKAHDWEVDQIADLFHTTTKVKTEQVTRSRGQHCGDVELAGYLANQADPVTLVLDLRITHERFGRSSDLSINGNLHYPNDKDRSLNETSDDKILKYRADYNNNPPISTVFMPAIAITSGRLHSEFIRLLFLEAHRETDRFFAVSGVQSAQSNRGTFHFKCVSFLGQLKAKIGSSLTKVAGLCVNLNIDGTPITSRSHTHPSHSQTSRLLTSSLSLCVPVPHTTEYM
jgi:hypothetical protein